MALTAMSFLQPAQSAEIKSGIGKSGQAAIWIIGELVPGDSDKFSSAVKQANDAGKYVANVRLDSPGGNLLEGAKIADSIRFGKMSTNVGKTAVCASACFLLFAAGSSKNVSYGAQIGVHGASNENGEQTAASGAATVSMAKMAKELGVPPAIIGRMVVTAPSDMVWLSPQDLQSMGTTIMGKPSQTAAAGAPMPLEPGQLARQTPQQTRPGDPTNLLPTSKNDAPLTWETLVNQAIEMSARQNGGRTNSMRGCQPELKVCINAVLFKMDGTDAMIKVTKDINDKITRREFCAFNSSGDIRLCLDWDTSKKHRDMKDARGDWSQVADE
ncbi:hypothetical protein A6452_38940 [Bradyrhizobium elkanii]|uniref:COG3904 family protein n=2 Tax=Bradyrhizobium elkanii TaxID=29448 RepID=UPI00086C5FC2|nr:hypothetical protein [Bradyrhizobium elkanii]ODM75031.1 hypothetical protein A6452_38940 [Bradyrhizobium elkanii]